MIKRKQWHATLFLNHSYLYIANVFHMIGGIFPEPLRGWWFKLLLKRLGKGVYIDNRVYFKFPWLVEIGDYVSINRGCEFYCSLAHRSKIRIGSNVLIGPHVKFFGAGHDYTDESFPDTGADIEVGDNVWIGGGALLLPGVTVGEGAVVAAGSIVTKNVAARTVIAGAPAKFVKMR